MLLIELKNAPNVLYEGEESESREEENKGDGVELLPSSLARPPSRGRSLPARQRGRSDT